jgi:hypothetical protein
MIKAEPVPIAWTPSFPVFASEQFLSAVCGDYGWLGGLDERGAVRCILPYTVIRRGPFRMVRFRAETILLDGLDVGEERSFLDSAMTHFAARNAALVMPATTNAVFRTYPTRADAVPYGSYVIDLAPEEEVLWKAIDRITRQNIKSASASGVLVREASTAETEPAYRLIRATFKRSGLPFMSLPAFRRYLDGLGEHGKILVADYQGSPQSYVVFGFSDFCAYAIYAGNAPSQQKGSNKLIYWEAIRLFRGLGVRAYDFFGTRVHPKKGSKQEALGLFKKRFGAVMKRGYMWRYSFHPIAFRLYRLAAYLRSRGDIVDAEKRNATSGDAP